MRVTIESNPLAPSYLPPFVPAASRGPRPVWISPREPGEGPEVVAYRLRFALDATSTARVHVSADERYELWLDGERVGRGPERGVRQAWFYESYDLPLAAGEHTLVARVWQLGSLAPEAQVSTSPGFLLVAEEPFTSLLSTGSAPWEAKRLSGYRFALPAVPGPAPWFAGANQQIDGARFCWGAELGEGEGWGTVTRRREDTMAFLGTMPAHMLTPALLPAQLSMSRPVGSVRYAAIWPEPWPDPQSVFVRPDAHDSPLLVAWQQMVAGAKPVVVPPHTRLQLVLDLGQYICAYPQLVTSGGAGSAITICWAEALFLDADGSAKGQRDDVEGRHFVAPSRDVFLPNGGVSRRFETLWWRAGRYIQLLVETAGEPLTVEALSLEETRYPLEMESGLTTSDERIERMVPLALRALQMCAHETFMDCPYYEQLMFAGDTRLEALTAYTIAADDRLARKALTLFDQMRGSAGLTPGHTPSRRDPVLPPFALWWVAMVHDYAAWRDNRGFVAGLLPGVRAVIDAFLGMLDDEGLLAAPPGWNFVDWVPQWPLGVPPDGVVGASGVLNWHLVYTLTLAAQLEGWAGEPELARRYERHRQQLAERITPRFWDEGRGLFADDLGHQHFSEHTQALALLSGAVSYERRERIVAGLLGNQDLTRTTIYFTHYLFEAYRLLGLPDALFERLGLWFDLPKQGLKTTPERPEPTRSDCHGWGAHPLFHCFATVLGIRPADLGFRRVEIAPLLGPLTSLSGSLVHPRGRIEVTFSVADEALRGTITLPPGVTGVLRYGELIQELTPGTQQIMSQVSLLG